MTLEAFLLAEIINLFFVILLWVITLWIPLIAIYRLIIRSSDLVSVLPVDPEPLRSADIASALPFLGGAIVLGIVLSRILPNGSAYEGYRRYLVRLKERIDKLEANRDLAA
jgi:hypothetical protein